METLRKKNCKKCKYGKGNPTKNDFCFDCIFEKANNFEEQEQEQEKEKMKSKSKSKKVERLEKQIKELERQIEELENQINYIDNEQEKELNNPIVETIAQLRKEIFRHHINIIKTKYGW